MKPLSVLYYSINNFKRIIPIGLSIALGVMFLSFLFLSGKQANALNEGAHIKPFEYYSKVWSTEGIPSDMAQALISNENVKTIIPSSGNPYTAISAALGNNSAGILLLRNKDIKFLMQEMSLSITEGRMAESSNEIILHWRIAANKKLKVGDIFADQSDVQNQFLVVGIFDGPVYVGFVPAYIQGENVEDWLSMDLLIIPESGKLEEMNAYIDSLPKTQGLIIRSLSIVMDEMEKNTKTLNLVMILLVCLVVIVLSITLANTSIMHFYQRKSEFGLLTVIGYTRWQIVRRIWLEAMMTYWSSYIIGIMLSSLLAHILNLLVWLEMGESIPIWNLKGAIITATIPLFVTIFSVNPILRLLKKKDVMQLIENI